MSVCTLFAILLVFLNDVTATVSRLNVACGGSPVHCYILYGASPSVTWTEAKGSCSGMNSSLAVIQNKTAQHVIQRLPKQGSASVQHAWIGGKRSADRRWTNIEGKVFGLMLPSSEQNPRCAMLYVSVDSRQVATFTDQPCFDTTNTGFIALCEVKDKTCNRICLPWGCVRGYNISSVCHVVTDTALISWEEARQYCRSRYQGELAYSVLNLNMVQLNADHKGQYLWIGAQTQHWVWISESGEKTFTYVNWTRGEGNQEDCALIDLNTSATWRDKPCTELNKYFICEITLLTTTTTTTTISTTVTSTSAPISTRTTAMTTSNTPSTVPVNTVTKSAVTAGQATTATPVVTSETTSVEVLQSTAQIGSAGSAVDKKITDDRVFYIAVGTAAGVFVILLIIVIAVCVNRKRRISEKLKEADVMTLSVPPVADPDTRTIFRDVHSSERPRYPIQSNTNLNKQQSGNASVFSDGSMKYRGYHDQSLGPKSFVIDGDIDPYSTYQAPSGTNPKRAPSAFSDQSIDPKRYSKGYLRPIDATGGIEDQASSEGEQNAKNEQLIQEEEVPNETIVYNDKGDASHIMTADGDIYAISKNQVTMQDILSY